MTQGKDHLNGSHGEDVAGVDRTRQEPTEESQRNQGQKSRRAFKNRFARDPSRQDIPHTPELERVQRFLLNYDVTLLHGPPVIEYEKDELVVLCLLRNGRAYVKSFVEHYFSLGAKHIVFLDNGSTDGTVEALRKYEDVTVLRTKLLFRRYQILMRQYLVERFGKDRWSLLVDIDELFDYPFSDTIGVKALLKYLNRHSYTAVVAHMLEMFPQNPITEESAEGDVPLKESHRFYDLSGTISYDYQNTEDVGNVVSNADIEILQGGVQGRLFNIRPLLTKHPLVFYTDGVKPVDRSEHWAGGVRVADFTGILYHYKLLSLRNLVNREMKERRYANRHGKYDKYLKVLEQSSELSVKNETSRELKSVNDLLGTQYNSISEEYVRYVAGTARDNIGTSFEEEMLTLQALSRAKAEARAARQQVQDLQNQVGKQQADKRRQSIDQVKQQADRALGELSQELEKECRERARLDHRNKNLEAHARNLEDQMRAIRSSKVWKLLTALGYIKRWVIGTPARIKAGLSGK